MLPMVFRSNNPPVKVFCAIKCRKCGVRGALAALPLTESLKCWKLFHFDGFPLRAVCFSGVFFFCCSLLLHQMKTSYQCVDCFTWFCSSFRNYPTFGKQCHIALCDAWKSLESCITWLYSCAHCVHLRKRYKSERYKCWLSTNVHAMAHWHNRTLLIMLVGCCEWVVIMVMVFIWFVLQRVCSGQKRSACWVRSMFEQFYPSLFKATKSVKNKPHGKYKRIVCTWRVPKNIVQSIKLAGNRWVWRYSLWPIWNAQTIISVHIKRAALQNIFSHHRLIDWQSFWESNGKCTRAITVYTIGDC